MFVLLGLLLSFIKGKNIKCDLTAVASKLYNGDDLVVLSKTCYIGNKGYVKEFVDLHLLLFSFCSIRY